MRTLCQRFAIILARLNILAEVFLPVHKGLHEEYLIVLTQKGVQNHCPFYTNDAFVFTVSASMRNINLHNFSETKHGITLTVQYIYFHCRKNMENPPIFADYAGQLGWRSYDYLMVVYG